MQGIIIRMTGGPLQKDLSGILFQVVYPMQNSFTHKKKVPFSGMDIIDYYRDVNTTQNDQF